MAIEQQRNGLGVDAERLRRQHIEFVEPLAGRPHRRLGKPCAKATADRNVGFDVEQQQAVRAVDRAQATNLAQLGFETVAIGQLAARIEIRSEEHTSELQSLLRISYAVFCLK